MLDQTILDDGYRLLAVSSTKNLQFGFRCKVMRLLNYNDQSSLVKPSVRIGKISIEKVLAPWNETTSHSKIPYRCFDLIARHPDEKLTEIERAEVLGFWTDCDNLSADIARDFPTKLYGVAAGYAAIKLVFEHFGLGKQWESILESVEYLDAYSNDPAFDASLAYAEGGPWDAASNTQKREEFWKWWLTECKAIGESLPS